MTPQGENIEGAIRFVDVQKGYGLVDIVRGGQSETLFIHAKDLEDPASFNEITDRTRLLIDTAGIDVTGKSGRPRAGKFSILK